MGTLILADKNLNEYHQYEQILNSLTALQGEVMQGRNGGYFSEAYIGEKLTRLVDDFAIMKYSEQS